MNDLNFKTASYTHGEVLVSFLSLLDFSGVMILVARWRFGKVTVAWFTY